LTQRPFLVGFTYLDLESTAVPHLWIVCAEPDEYPDERVIVSITSDGPYIRDRSCQLNPGDHGFIKHTSYALFAKAKVVTVGDLKAWMTRGNLELKDAASPQLLERIRVAAMASPYTPRTVKAAIRDCWWTPP
jgi:hypothetical protein